MAEKKKKIKQPSSSGRQSKQTQGDSPTLSHMLGEIFWLLGRSPAHGFLFVRDLDWMVYPPVRKRQFFVFHNEDKQPVALALWAYVNEETEKRLELGMSRLKPDEWDNGDSLWLVDLVTPFGKSELVLDRLKSSILAGKTFKYHKRNKQGQLEIVEDSGSESENVTKGPLKDIKDKQAAAQAAGKRSSKGTADQRK